MVRGFRGEEEEEKGMKKKPERGTSGGRVKPIDVGI